MESKYIIKFDIDQRDGDYITIATGLISGKPDRDLLIDLCIINNYSELEVYDYEWYNLSGMEEYLYNLWGGFIYEPCNRFTINSVVIEGLDGDTMRWYEIKDFSMDMLKKLGITDINKEYRKRFKSYDDDYDDDYDEEYDEEEFGEGEKTRSFH